MISKSMRLSSLSAFPTALFFVHSNCSVPDEIVDSILEYVPEDVSPLNFFAASKRLSLFRRAAFLPLNRKQSRRYIANEDGFQAVVNATRDNPRKQIRLNLGEDFRKYLVNAEFRATVNSLVDNHLEQVWSDLDTLCLYSAQVWDIRPLGGLKNLKTLILSYTQVTDIRPLAGLKNLKTLKLSRTQVTDFIPLAELENLEELYLDGTQVLDIRPLDGLKNLKVLELSHTQVADINPLAGLEDLKVLHLSYTQVTDISPLAGLDILKNLRLSHTRVADISPLAGLKNVVILWLDGSRVDDISPLAHLPNLSLHR